MDTVVFTGFAFLPDGVVPNEFDASPSPIMALFRSTGYNLWKSYVDKDAFVWVGPQNVEQAIQRFDNYMSEISPRWRSYHVVGGAIGGRLAKYRFDFSLFRSAGKNNPTEKDTAAWFVPNMPDDFLSDRLMFMINTPRWSPDIDYASLEARIMAHIPAGYVLEPRNH